MRFGRLTAATFIASLIFTASAQAMTARSAVGWGFNGKAEAGAGFISDRVLEPVGVLDLSTVKTVAAAGFWGAALLRDGTVKTWGGNNDGQLGDGTTDMKATPLTVAGLGRVKQIATAGEHFIALLADGTVMTWGSNHFGQLGNGTDGGGKEACSSLCNSTRPIPVVGLSGVVAVFAGGASDAALLSDGTIMAWGENKSGQLGDGTTIQKDRPTRAQFTNVKTLALGGEATLGGHMLVLGKDGTLQSVGENTSGQLGDGSSVRRSLVPVPVRLSGVRAISASWTHSIAVLKDGSLHSWGSNRFGELGTSTATTCLEHALPCAKTPLLVPGLHKVRAISAGYGFSLAVSAHRAYAWGHNRYGQLGDGTRTDRSTPAPVNLPSEVAGISAGNTHAYAVLRATPPAPDIVLTPGPGSLTVSWQPALEATAWTVAYRPVTDPAVKFSAKVKLATSTLSFTITGLEQRPYEVSIVEVPFPGTFGKKVVSGTPQPLAAAVP